MRWRKRIARIKRARLDGVTFYRMSDGSIKGIRSKNILQIFDDVNKGRNTPGARVLLTAVECISSNSRLHALFQSLRPDPLEDTLQ